MGEAETRAGCIISHGPSSLHHIACGTVLALLFALSLALVGCGKNAAEQALDSDANGYLCLACETRFYTDREVFATRCPSCGKPKVDQVLGFVCPADKHVTLATRGRGAMACEKCGKGTSAVSIPREQEFKAWGAVKKSGAEVGG